MSRQVFCGSVPIGGGAPISIQSMTNTDTRDEAATFGQIRALAAAGCDIVRCAVPDMAAADALGRIIARLRGADDPASDAPTHLRSIPIVADIHFDYRLAIAAIDAGADKIRINPGNIGGADKVAAVVRRAKAAGVPIRIGVNGGSLEKSILEQYGGPTPAALAASALRNIEAIQAMGFDDLVISIKSSDVRATSEALRLLAPKTDCPVHAGITEAGMGQRALVKSAVGIGALLLIGIGDTIRVSITGDPIQEIPAAQDILASLGLLPGAIEIISCPTCGRCRVDLDRVVQTVTEAVLPLERTRIATARSALFRRRRTAGMVHSDDSVFSSAATPDENQSVDMWNFSTRPLTLAVMGCAVNGPGEAAHADFGVACGDGKGLLFKKGEAFRTVLEHEIAPALLQAVREQGTG